MDYLGIALGGVAALVLGFIWYNPKVFGTAWMKGLGLNEEDLQQGNMAVIFGLAFLLAAVVAYSMNMYGAYHEAAEQTFTHGAFHGAQSSLFFALPVLITNSLFERQKWANILINAGYWVVVFAVIGGIVFAIN